MNKPASKQISNKSIRFSKEQPNINYLRWLFVMEGKTQKINIYPYQSIDNFYF